MKLSDEQLAVVAHRAGPAMAVACPGSGKTTVVIHRLVELIQAGVPEADILCVTFTKNAASEMRERAASMLGHKPACYIKTFHGLCAHWLRRDIDQLDCGLTSSFTVMDDGESDLLLNELWAKILTRFNLQKDINKTFKPNDRNALVAAVLEGFKTFDGHDFEYLLRPLMADYQAAKLKMNVIDFADLMLLGNRLLASPKYNEIHKWVMVDEFQDSNPANLQLALQLGAHGNIMVVGDPDQSIYGFRHAVPNVFDQFKAKTEAKLYHLSTTRRFGQLVAAAASALVNQLPGTEIRKPVTSLRDKHATEKIKYVRFDDSRQEARYIANIAAKFVAQTA